MADRSYKICLSVATLDDEFIEMRDRLSAVADVTVTGLKDYSLDGIDVFIGKMLDGKALDRASSLKAVFAYKTGVDDFPLDALAVKGVTLCNSHANSRYIAEYAFSLAVTLVSRTAEFDRKMRVGDWSLADPYWKSLIGMRVGLVGYGGIGREIHRLLSAFGIKTYTIDRGKNYDGITALPTLDELCRKCDLLILSLPNTRETDNMINARVLDMLGGKFIVNVGRNNCIDESALYAALKSGALGGAAIDTWREKQRDGSKPLKPFDAPFDTLDNIVLSSHKAMQVFDGHARYVDDTTDNVLGFIAGKPLRNVVDLKTGY